MNTNQKLIKSSLLTYLSSQGLNSQQLKIVEEKINQLVSENPPELVNAVNNLPHWLRESAECLEFNASRNGAVSTLTPKLNWYADKIENALKDLENA